MKVLFVKDHPSGLKKDAERELQPLHAKRLHDEGYIVLSEEELASLSATPKQPEAPVVTGEADKKIEPEFTKVKLSQKDINRKVYGELSEGKKAGDEIEVPNPNFKPEKTEE